MRTVALFGGSFDPPHIGHEAIVQALTQLNYIEKIIVMPTYLNPFKQGSVAPAVKRLEWLQKAFVQYEKVTISSYEVLQNKKVPSFDTVTYLLQKYEKIYLVIGADNLKSLTSWYRYDELASKVTFIVASRDKIKIPEHFIHLDVDIAISSSALRGNLDSSFLPQINAQEIMQYYKEKNE